MTTSVRAYVRHHLKYWIGAGAAVSVSALSLPALADTQASSEAGNLEEIVVTAQFRAQNLQETPVAITAVNADMMEQRGQTSLHDLAQQAPNVTLLETGAAFGPGMTASIRGIGQYDFDPALAPGVGLYIDDVYYTSLTGSNFALLDLDRVEILRGPQGTLAGANSEGGAIKIYSVKPQNEEHASVKASYGERNLVDVQAMGNMPLIADTLFLRISGVSHQQDGYVTRIDYGCAFPTSGIPSSGGSQNDCIAGREGGKSYHGGRAALRWLAGDNFEANFSADITVDNSEIGASTLLSVNSAAGGAILGGVNSGFPPGNPAGVAFDNRFVPNNPYVSYANFCAVGIAKNTYCWAPYTHTKSDGYNLTLDYKLTDSLSVKSITAFRQFDSQWTNDDDTSPIGSSLGWSEINNHTFTQELRLNGKIENLLDYTVGGYYLSQVTTYPTHQVLDYVFPGSFDFLGDDPVRNKDYAAFANATWHIVGGLDFNGGVRYTHDEKDYTYNRWNPPSIGGGPSVFFPPTFSGTTGSYSGGRTDYRANLDYRWTPQIMTFVSVSTGFKGGGSNPRPFIPTQVQPFAPETLTAYELGAKTEWFDRSLRLNVSGFFEKYKDIQVTLLSCPAYSGGNAAFPCAAPVNGGDADIGGIEAELTYQTHGFSFEGSVSRQNFVYKSINPNAGIPLGADDQGFQPMKWSLAAQYEAKLPVGGSITPRLDFIYASGFFTNASNDAASYNPGYHDLNGRVTFRPESSHWEFALAGTNLANKLWYTSRFDLSFTQGQVYGLPTAPRTIWGEVKLRM